MKQAKLLVPPKERRPGVPLRQQLGFIGWFAPWFKSLGLDFDQMMDVLVLKATVLLRTEVLKLPRGKNAGDKPKPDPGFFGFSRSLQSWLISFMITIMIFMFEDPATMLAMVFLVGFVMQFLRVITTFPVLILDTKDATLLATQPLAGRNIAAAKTILTVLYLLTETVAVYALPLIPILIKGYWLVIPGYLIGVVLSNLVSVALVYLLYGLVLRFYDGEKLKDIISFMQIALGIVTILGYQVVSRMGNLVDLKARLEFAWWQVLVPPLNLAWLAGGFMGGEHLAPALACLAATLAFLLFHALVSARLLEENLQKMLGEGEKPRHFEHAKKVFVRFLARVLLRKPQAWAFFVLSASVTGNDRKLKQILYPALFSLMLMPFILVFSMWQGAKVPFERLFVDMAWIVYSPWIFTLSIMPMAGLFKKSEQSQGAWIFDTLPIFSRSLALKGAGLGFLLRFICLPMLALSLVILAMAGPVVLANLAVINLGNLLAGIFQWYRLSPDWPHSLPLTHAEAHQGRTFVLTLLLVLALAGVQVAIGLLLGPAALWLYCLALTGGIALLWAGLGRLTPPAKPENR